MHACLLFIGKIKAESIERSLNMKKLLPILVFALLAFSQTTVLAHSKLESSNPEQGSSVSEKLETIQLVFNTDIEDSSTFTVMKDGNKEVPVENIQISGPELSGTVPNTMENGSYTVSWDIVGADGHVIKDSITFTYNGAEETPPAEEEAPAPEEEPEAKDPASSEEPEEKNSAAKETPAEEPAQNNQTLLIIGGILAAAAAGAVFFSMKKGRR